MKKIQLLTLSSITILSILMGGTFSSCAGGNSSSSVTSSSESVSSSTASSSSSSSEVIDGHYDMWTEAQKTLMIKYCGEVLPYPVGLVDENLTVEEITIDDYSYLQISDTSSSFTLNDYYKTVENFGWNTIKGYSGEAKQLNGDTEYYEITKKASVRNKGYELIYFYAEEEKDDEGNVTSSAGNVLRCHNDLVSFETADTKYSDEDLENMHYATTTTTLPFLKMGGQNQIGISDANTFVVMDFYVYDYSKENADILVKNGFTLDDELSTKYNSYILHKTLEDGSTIDAQIYYFQGNNAYFTYSPNTYEGTTWPTALANDIKNKTGVEVPQFEIAEGGKYYAYEKNGEYYIYTLSLKNDYDYEYYGEVQLQNPALTWNEKISFSYMFLSNDDYENVGYLVAVTTSEAESTFVTSWPSELISSTITDVLKVNGITLPSFSEDFLPHKEMNIKYTLKGEDYYKKYYLAYLEDITSFPEDYNLSEDATEEQIVAKAKELALKEMGLSLSVYDENGAFYNAYADAFRKLGWYENYTSENDLYFEDPTGALMVTFTMNQDPNWDYCGKTTITFSIGSGEEHTPEFYFDSDELSVGIGYSSQLSLNKSMLPYEVTYSSSDETGNITVSEDGKVSVKEGTSDGASATITASITVPGEDEPRTTTCVVTAITLKGYTAENTSKDVKALIDQAGYASTVTKKTNEWDETQYNIDVNLGSASVEDVKGFVTSALIPADYEVLKETDEDGDEVDSTWYDDQYLIDEENEVTVDCETIVYSVDNPIDLYLDYGFSYGVLIKYHVYVQDGATHLVIEVLNF